MHFETTKTILFGLTLLVLLYLVFFEKKRYHINRLFILSSALITILLISVIELKIHHILRSEFRIPNTLTYIIIFVPFSLHIYKFRNVILQTEVLLLIMSLFFIVSALLLDLLTDAKILVISYSDLIEEILRIAGAFFWMLYYVSYLNKSKRISDSS